MLAGRVLKGLEIERLKRDFRSQKIQEGLEIERLKRGFGSQKTYCLERELSGQSMSYRHG